MKLKISALLAVLILSSCAQNPARVELVPSAGEATSGQHGVSAEREGLPQMISGEENLSLPQVALLEQAHQHITHRELSLAATKMERAIRINPNAVKPYRLLAELRLQQGNKNAAAQLARKGLSLIAKKGKSYSYHREKARLENILQMAESTTN